MFNTAKQSRVDRALDLATNGVMLVPIVIGTGWVTIVLLSVFVG